jgi:hypothetical protein
VEELRRLAFDGVSQELKTPSHDEHAERKRPEPIDPDGGQEQWQGEDDERNTYSMAKSVEWMLMTVAILTDPLVPTLSSEHSAS